jgi:hypothetical protein
MMQRLQEEKGAGKFSVFELTKTFRVRRPHPRPFSSIYWLSNDAGVARGEGRRKKF